MTVVFIRAVILYLLLLAAVRFMGKHQIGELQPSELAVTILISNIATLPVEDTGMPLFTGIIPVLTLACLDVVMSCIGVKSRTVRNLTGGKPVVIVSNGRIDQKKMRDLRFTVDDLIEAMHSLSIFDISEVQYAVVETTGTISIYQKYEYRNVTNKDMRLHGKSIDPPEIIIEDGSVIEENLKRTGIDMSRVNDILKKEKTIAKDIFLMTMDSEGTYSVVRKERSRREKK
ncbi:MAG: DUF421 domain-containing protein [Oscillospiraceae bacterium]|nr:DUF421 domain-containing protein [Oscillospiraceae bacterium]